MARVYTKQQHDKRLATDFIPFTRTHVRMQACMSCYTRPPASQLLLLLLLLPATISFSPTSLAYKRYPSPIQVGCRPCSIFPTQNHLGRLNKAEEAKTSLPSPG